MADKPYTDADVELAARAEYEHDMAAAGGTATWGDTFTFVRDAYRDRARAGLDALAAAGRLLPADARLAIEDALIASERQRWGDVPDRVAIAEWADEIHGRLAGQPEERR